MDLDQNLDIPSFKIHLGPERLRTMGAEVFILVSIRKDQKKPLSYRHRLPAIIAVKVSGCEIFILVLFHDLF